MSDPRLGPIVESLQANLKTLVALVVSPAQPPAALVKPRFAVTGAGLVVLWRVVMTIAVVIHTLMHIPAPTPPAPVPPAPAPPLPAPIVPPLPAPAPVAHVTAKLFAIQVFNPEAMDAGTLHAVAIGGDPATEVGLAPLNVEWRHWDVGEPMLDTLKLRAFLPDPARLPALLIYDATGQFYDLAGNKLSRTSPVSQVPPQTVPSLISAFKAIRSK